MLLLSVLNIKKLRMKKSLLILIFFPMIGFGQNQSFEAGLLFGGSFNSLNSLEANKGSWLGESDLDYLCPMGGITGQYNFTKRFSLKSKLLYHIKGERRKYGSINMYTNFHYVTFPLLAQLNFSKKKWGFFCNTGVYLARLIKVESILTQPPDYFAHANQDLDYFKKFDFGIILGYGVSFKINERARIFLESSLDYGLLNTSKNEFPKTSTEAMTVTMGIAYSFTKKRKVFNGKSKLECADHEEKINLDEKKKSKWRLILYKDGKKVGGKSKKGESRLFKKKN